MSGAWYRTFNGAGGNVTVSFRYNLNVSNNYELDEFGQTLFAIDGQLIGNAGNDYLAQLTASATGWQTFSTTVNLASFFERE